MNVLGLGPSRVSYRTTTQDFSSQINTKGGAYLGYVSQRHRHQVNKSEGGEEDVCLEVARERQDDVHEDVDDADHHNPNGGHGH